MKTTHIDIVIISNLPHYICMKQISYLHTYIIEPVLLPRILSMIKVFILLNPVKKHKTQHNYIIHSIKRAIKKKLFIRIILIEI